MSPLLLPQVQSVLHAAAEQCALGIESANLPFFKELEWWVADGVINLEPHGMFRVETPYRVGDLRTVREFLQQDSHHQWEGVRTLMDLFNNHVEELLSDWCQEYLQKTLFDDAPDEDEWDNVYAVEWEGAMFLADIHPKSTESLWDEFLNLPLLPVVERWRLRAEVVAKERRYRAARMVSRQDVEQAMVDRVKKTLEKYRANHETPHDIERLLLEIREDLGEWGPLEVALYVHSSMFVQGTEASLLARLFRAHPIPKRWTEDERGMLEI